MKNKKVLFILLGLILMLAVVACGNKETVQKRNDKKVEETVQNGLEEPKQEEKETDKEVVEETKQSEVEEEQQPVQQEQQATTTSKSKSSTSTNTKKENGKTATNKPDTTPSKSSSSTNKPSTSTPSTGTTQPTTPSTPTHEHDWQPVEKGRYTIVEHYIYGCNGCGYPLFTISGSDAVNLPNLYSHPECYSEKMGMMCTGGGFHSEWFAHGYCGLCGGEVMRRQCMFSEMGKSCVKNEALGAYEHVEIGQNPMAYFKSCNCGKNMIFKDGVTGEGIIYDGYQCTICGAKKAD